MVNLPPLNQRVDAVRRFNRFYTRRIGVLEERLLGSRFSLTEARVIFELAHHPGTTATRLGNDLDLDAGYLSRLLAGFEEQSLLRRVPDPGDGRASLLSLTERGESTFARLDARSRQEIRTMLVELPPRSQARLLGAIATIEALLGAQPDETASYLLRQHRPGDLGYVVHRHGVVYAHEYGWDGTFEAMVARIVSEFVTTFDPEAERCWIAEREGEIIGSVLIARASDTVAQIRLLLVEPAARGLGLGRRLVDECIRFSKAAGYERISLWTDSGLSAARHIYEQAGFQLVNQKKHHSFGHDLVGQTWELLL